MWRQKENIGEEWSRQSLELDELTAQGYKVCKKKEKHFLSFYNSLMTAFNIILMKTWNMYVHVFILLQPILRILQKQGRWINPINIPTFACQAA